MLIHNSGNIEGTEILKISHETKDEQIIAYYSEKYFTKTHQKLDINAMKTLFKLIKNAGDNTFFIDIGCENGTRLDYLYQNGIKGIGLDIAITNIIQGRQKFPHLKFIHGFAEEIPFLDNYFDLALFGINLKHTRNPEEILFEAIRVTKHALFFIITHNHENDDWITSPMSIQKLKDFLKDFKLDISCYLPNGTEYNNDDLYSSHNTSETLIIKAIITSSTTELLNEWSLCKKNEQEAYNYSLIIEKDQWEKTPGIVRHESELARFNLVSHLIQGGHVLEMACGNGDGLSEIINHKLRVVGIDISKNGIIHARTNNINKIKENEINFCLMDCFETAFKDNSFDTVIIPEVLEHIRSTRRIIQEAVRVVRHGGRIIISVPDGLLVPWEGHLRIFFKDTLETEIKQYTDDIEWHSLPFKKWLFCSFFVFKPQHQITDGPLVDILMPTYNGRETIRKAITSVQKQTYSNWNLIVVNDGGEDVSDIIQSLDDPRIKYIVTKHGGKSHALNIGIHKSYGEFISYFDDDDIIYPLHIEMLILSAIERNKGFVYSDWYEVSINESGDEINRYIEYSTDVTPLMLFYQNYINHKCILHKREYLSIVGDYDESLKVLIDWDMIRRLAFVEAPFHVHSFSSEHYQYFIDGKIQNKITSIWSKNNQIGEQTFDKIIHKSNKMLTVLTKKN
ncbi:methyltransferase domain-containing protein [Methanospirillum sp. J.3.6.1-F.2.7.3]|uniref:Methyltransferase domain-containing protein n=1 Tax=Methanospirillum purgamenti TaxID=2834276 RepID=A0A8E7AZK1_9EURY|nr:methyltransferase domain-containing protein [Methanospirillum sp. J.3.6.1-F.2.7.3]QVV89209.1 methyltransferase domain-containing protein [Methanospirillum sp. J.3.6.1-F.2.7.3]